jgi:NAD-dependent deacetylase
MTFPPNFFSASVAHSASSSSRVRASPLKAACRHFAMRRPAFGQNSRPEDLATPTAFRREPRLVWEWYAWRRELVAKANPKPGARRARRMEKRASSFTLITQNVDGLHRRAGSRNVIELHGNITRTKCFRRKCGCGELAGHGRNSPALPTMRCFPPARRRLVRRGDARKETSARLCRQRAMRRLPVLSALPLSCILRPPCRFTLWNTAQP